MIVLAQDVEYLRSLTQSDAVPVPWTKKALRIRLLLVFSETARLTLSVAKERLRKRNVDTMTLQGFERACARFQGNACDVDKIPLPFFTIPGIDMGTADMLDRVRECAALVVRYRQTIDLLYYQQLLSTYVHAAEATGDLRGPALQRLYKTLTAIN